MKQKELIRSTSAAANMNSVPLDIGDFDTYSIVVFFSGADVVGVAKLQAAIDDVDAEYIDIYGSSKNIAASGDVFWNVNGAAYRFVRVNWTYTSGTGNISAKGIIKENVVKNQ